MTNWFKFFLIPSIHFWISSLWHLTKCNYSRREKRRKFLQCDACTRIAEWSGRLQINILNAKIGPPGVWQIFHSVLSGNGNLGLLWVILFWSLLVYSFAVSFITGFIYVGLSPVIMSVIEIAAYDIVWCLKLHSLATLTCTWNKSFCFFLSLTQTNPNTAATILFSLPAYKYAIMVRLLCSLLGWLEWRLRLSGSSNVGLMVLTCAGHRWSPEQPWLGPFIKAGLAPEMARLAICVRGRFHSQYCWWTEASHSTTTAPPLHHHCTQQPPHAHIHSVL